MACLSSSSSCIFCGRACEVLATTQADKVQEAEAVMLNPLTPPQRGSLDDQSRQVRQKVAAGLRDLAQRIEQQPELLSKAADLMSLDFMDNRAPPPEVSPIMVISHDFTNHDHKQ